MLENLPRTLLVITIIIAVAAIFFGVRDYFGKKQEATPSATTPAATAVDSNSATARKKNTSARARRVRLSGEKANASSTARVPATGMERALTKEEAAASTANAIVANGDSSRATTLGAAYPNARGTVLPQGHDSARKTASPKLSDDEIENVLTHTDCVPLPNLTQPGDVDAPYYQNWAKEYGCVWEPE